MQNNTSREEVRSPPNMKALSKRASALKQDILQRVVREFGWNSKPVFVALLGSTDHQFSVVPQLEPKFCAELGLLLAQDGLDTVFLTGGNPESGRLVCQAIQEHGKPGTIFHLIPTEMEPEERFTSGCVIRDVGETMFDRQIILSSMADISVAFGGGPGTLNELWSAHLRGNRAIPLPFTGGAADKYFSENNDALVNEENQVAWKVLTQKPEQLAQQEPDRAAKELAQATLTLIKQHTLERRKELGPLWVRSALSLLGL